jgi:hypothetical protein
MIECRSMSGSINLVFKGTPGESVPVRGGFTTTFDVSGPPILTRQLTGTNPMLALQTYRMSGEGRRTVEADERGCAVRIMYDHAHVEGIFGSKPFDFDVSPAMPENFKEDKLVEIAWGLAMAGRHYLLGPKGEYRPAKAATDAHGEAFAMLIDAPLRLPEEGVNVGQEWTTEWAGECTHKDTGATFHYRQTAVLEELINGQSARITYSTAGTLEFLGKPSPQREGSVFEAKATMVLDLQAGLPVMVETSGTLTTELKQAGVKMVRGTSARTDAA